VQISQPYNMTEETCFGGSTMPLKHDRAYRKFFQETLAQHNPAIMRVVTSYERIKALQEELYQEISVALWKSLAKFDNQSSLKTYILSIAHKRSISHVAKYAKEPRSTEIVEYELPQHDCPSSELAAQQRISKLLNGLNQLSLVERQLVTLALEGVSYLEIAEILGMTTNLVGVKLNRAKAKLKTIMENSEG
jgi:RNA polymerase sigma-70 factor, ECF subfamily